MPKAFAITNQSNHIRDPLQQIANKGDKVEYHLDYKPFEDDAGDVLSVTWTTLSGHAIISNEILSDSISRVAINYLNEEKVLIKVEAKTDRETHIIYMSVKVKDPNTTDDYGYSYG